MNKISFQYVSEQLYSFGENIIDGEEALIMRPPQVRILIDENDYLGDLYGMYPEDFFSQNKHFFKGELQTGICGCSCYGCHDHFVKVDTLDNTVVWIGEKNTEYQFDKNEYTDAIEFYKKENNCGKIYEKANEIIMNKLNGKMIKNNFVYDTFVLYEYGNQIILYFSNDNCEEKYCIYWRDIKWRDIKNFSVLEEKISTFMENNIIK